jgi:hypothetical protein
VFGYAAIQDIARISYCHDDIWFFAFVAKDGDPGSHIDAAFDGAKIVVAIYRATFPLA